VVVVHIKGKEGVAAADGKWRWQEMRGCQGGGGGGLERGEGEKETRTPVRTGQLMPKINLPKKQGGGGAKTKSSSRKRKK